MKKHTEARLEDAIVDSLTREGGFELVDYRHGPAAGRYDKALALDPAQCDALSAAGRRFFLDNDAAFRQRLGSVVRSWL